MNQEIKELEERKEEIQNNPSGLSRILEEFKLAFEIGGPLDRALFSGAKEEDLFIRSICSGTLGIKYATIAFSVYAAASLIDKYLL